MLVYTYKGKKCLTSGSYKYSEKNYLALFEYNKIFFRCDNYLCSETLARHIYNSYSTLCKFNNELASNNNVDKSKISFVEDYLQQNQDIKESVDIQCIKIYNKLNTWYHRLLNNPTSLDEIKWEVVRLMKFYENQGIYRIASINLKQNYYDFCL